MTDDLYNEAQVCILKYHTDMYYNSLPGYLLSHEYGHDGSGTNEKRINKDTLISKLQIFINFIHGQMVASKVPDMNFSKNQLEKWGELYGNLIYRGRMYDQVITTYVIYNSKLAKLVNESFGGKDELTNYTKFYRECMQVGYTTAFERMERGIETNSILGHDVYEDNNTSVVKVYLSIDGYLNKMKLIKKSNQELNELLDEYLLKHNFYRSTSEELVDKLKTKYIFRSKETGEYYYFKRREINLDYAKFDEQDRKNPMVALIGQGQINLTVLR